MKQMIRFFKVDLLIMLSVAVVLTACGGGGGSDSGTTGGGQTPSVAATVLHGSVGDGPIVGANVKVFDKNLHLLAVQTSDIAASYEMTVQATSSAYPLILEASGGQDTVTGKTPDFTLKSIVLQQSAKQRANINPFSTLIVQTAAAMPGGLTAANVALAKQAVLQQLNFGLDASLMADPITSTIDHTNIGVIVRSSEALGESVRRTRDAMKTVDPTITADQVVDALSADLVDGVVDGLGAVKADARVAAVSQIASAQVLLEVMTGGLKVNAVDASVAMDNAVQLSVPSGVTGSVNDLALGDEMVAQTVRALAAAQAIDTNVLLVSSSDALASLQSGSQPADVAAVMPANVDVSLTTTLSSVVVASPTSLEQVNVVARSAGQQPGGTNTPPTIQGTPVTSVTVGAAYSFQPNADDVDGDTLSFSVVNLPTWANFNLSTGELSGTPNSAGVWSAITISVSDGVDQVALPAFAISVSSVPNVAPTISGSPLTSIEENATYDFVPTASDADGDTLNFSVTNLPSWATFNPANGEISGTPTTLDVGVSSNIVVKVSDGKATVALPAFSISVTAISTTVGTATLSWLPPTENTDGSVLSDLAGFKIRYGTAPGNYTSVISVDNPGITSYVVDNLPGGKTYYFVVTAFTTSGIESGFSSEGSKTIP